MLKNDRSKLVIIILTFISILTSQIAYTKNKARIDSLDNDTVIVNKKADTETDKDSDSDKTSKDKKTTKFVPAKSYKVKGKKYVTLNSNKAKDLIETGYASWYGPGFHGKKTANGERYNQNALTAAHKTLPLSSKIRVTNLETNKSLVLRVNDRGPFYGNRILDLSKAAAKDLGVLKKGTAKIKIEVISV